MKNVVFLILTFLLSRSVIFCGAVLFLWMAYMNFPRFSSESAIDIVVECMIFTMLSSMGILFSLMSMSHIRLFFGRQESEIFADPLFILELQTFEDSKNIEEELEKDKLDFAKFKLERDLKIAEESLDKILEEKPPQGLSLEIIKGIFYTPQEVPNSVLRMYTSASIGNLFGIK